MNRKPQSGLTLVELVVVLGIIAVTLTLVLPRLSLPWHQSALAQHARNIQALIHMAEDESAIRGVILGLRVKDNTLEILQLQNNSWEPAPKTSLPGHYALPAPLRLSLADEKSPFAKTGDEGSSLPVVILPDGQVTTFDIRIENALSGETVFYEHRPDIVSMK